MNHIQPRGSRYTERFLKKIDSAATRATFGPQTLASLPYQHSQRAECLQLCHHGG